MQVKIFKTWLSNKVTSEFARNIRAFQSHDALFGAAEAQQIDA
jgi:hypothetical protein